ncbi:MAG: YggT family protein [Deltaproteobacteria bacterium]|nr:YggT family protein [Deltaproteobacteria bacterium]MBW1793016.1 YggT family protein [Deltaproteobacteria bacterium]MBW2329600.1 YggT family protein [Deltaproteobacteria bacterium]MCK4487297.1 YggT family protein [Desulfobacterales bacterium]
MFVVGYFLSALATVLDYALIFYMWVVIAGAVLSWVSPDPYNPIVRFIHNVTEPVLYRVRRWLPFGITGIDFSPLVVLLIIIFLRTFLVNSLMRLAARLL